MKTCSRCKQVYYHDVECQKKHWKIHKQSCGKPAFATKSSTTSNRPKQKHRSMDTVHQLVTRRFKELRKQGVPVHEAMTRAREEHQPSTGEMDPASQGGFCRSVCSICNSLATTLIVKCAELCIRMKLLEPKRVLYFKVLCRPMMKSLCSLSFFLFSFY